MLSAFARRIALPAEPHGNEMASYFQRIDHIVGSVF